MKPARLLVQARQEIRDAAEYYERQAKGLGVDYVDEINAAVSDICKNPKRWPVINASVHRRLVRRFPYCLLYREDANDIVVLAVMHMSRHPLYWQGRK